MPGLRIFGCAGLRKAYEICFHSSLPIKDEAWFQFFARFSNFFVTLQTTRFDCLGGDEKSSFICLSTYERGSIVPIFCKHLKNIFSYPIEMAASVANDANAFEYSVAPTCERLKKSSFIALHLINILHNAIFLQEI